MHVFVHGVCIQLTTPPINDSPECDCLCSKFVTCTIVCLHVYLRMETDILFYHLMVKYSKSTSDHLT